MPDRGEQGWGEEGHAAPRRPTGLLATSLGASSRALQAETDRWFLWLPVLFAGLGLAGVARALLRSRSDRTGEGSESERSEPDRSEQTKD